MRALATILAVSLGLAACASPGATRGGTDRTLAAATDYLKATSRN